jgi:hypothetical protein
MTGLITAVQIRRLQERKIRKIEDGPVGGSWFYFGEDVLGYAMDAPLPEEGPWNLARIKDGALAQVAYQMTNCGRVSTRHRREKGYTHGFRVSFRDWESRSLSF